MWLGEMFAELGCQTIPALHCRQALDLVKRFDLPIAIVIVNPELRGAKRAVKVLMAANPGVRVVLICNPAVRRNEPQADGNPSRSILERPAPGEPVSRADWVRKIRKILADASGTWAGA
jgi:hypothetical protein